MGVRARQPGTMRERPPGSGHWQMRAYAGDDPLTGRPVQVSRTFVGTERQAAKELSRLVTEVSDGRFQRTTATVGQLLDEWLEQARTTQRPRTLYENRSKIDTRIRPRLGALKLAKLRPDTLDAAYRAWLDEGLSPTTVHKFHSILSAACRQAVRWGWIDRAPTDLASPPAPARKDMVVPTPERLVRVVAAAEADDPVLATAVGLAALTGARRGELVALRWSDVDLVAARVRIARSATVAGGELIEGPTKTHQARELALDELAVEVLQKRRASMAALAEQAASPLVADPYVLSYNANGGRPVNPDTLTHRFANLCRKMENKALRTLRESHPKASRRELAPADRLPYRFHDLGHFSVTTLIAAGVDIRTVAERHGHAQATMTLNRYAHALPERGREAAAVLGMALGRARAAT